MTRISLDRIASIESRRHELAQAMAQADVSPEEFVKHALEKELAKLEDADSEDEIKKRLQGLGYIS